MMINSNNKHWTINLSVTKKKNSSQDSINTELITPATETRFFCFEADTEIIPTLDRKSVFKVTIVQSAGWHES